MLLASIGRGGPVNLVLSGFAKNMQDLRGTQFPPVAQAIYEESRRQSFDLVSEPLTGSLLRTLASSKPLGAFLELGTGSVQPDLPVRFQLTDTTACGPVADLRPH
jgi:hypothetical protein